MRKELAIESTTLPEGAVVSVARVSTVNMQSGHETKPHTEIEAKNDKATIRMTIAEVSPNALRDYLLLSVREINRQRSLVKPNAFDKPKDFSEFVSAMAAHSMFMPNALPVETSGSMQ